jgi:phage terminase small subunit
MTSLAETQTFAVDSLPEKRRRFVLAYCGSAKGNATEAARQAGYEAPSVEGCRLLRNVAVLEAIQELELAAGTDTESMVMGVIELRRFWTRTARGEESDVQVTRTKEGEQAEEIAVPIVPRLKASELLGKSLGAFIDRHQVEVVGAPKDEAEALAMLQRHAARLGYALVKIEGEEADDGDE